MSHASLYLSHYFEDEFIPLIKFCRFAYIFYFSASNFYFLIEFSRSFASSRLFWWLLMSLFGALLFPSSGNFCEFCYNELPDPLTLAEELAVLKSFCFYCLICSSYLMQSIWIVTSFFSRIPELLFLSDTLILLTSMK